MVFLADITRSDRKHVAAADWSPAVHRAAGLAGWTLVIGCLVWRGPFRFVMGTVGAGLLMRGARHDATAPSGARRARS